jgi:hypothetical protein
MSRPDSAFWRRVAGSLLISLMLGSPAVLAQKKQQKKAPAKAESGRREEEGDAVRRREEWFLKQRRYPLPIIPGGARQQAIKQREAIRQDLIRRGLLPAPANSDTSGTAGNPQISVPTNWVPIGPTPTSADGFDFFNRTLNTTLVSGRINSIAVDPTNSNTIYLGGADGGLWKSINGGTTWTAMTDSQPSLAIGSIAIDPQSPQTIYVGTGELNFAGDNYYGAGILKSIDGGMTWSQLGANAGSVKLIQPYTPPPGVPAPDSFVGPFNQALGGSFFSDIVVNPTNSNKLLAAVRIFVNVDTGASSGVFCSDDGGINWLQVVAGAPGTAVVIDPGGTNAYAALGNNAGDPQNGVYKSANANASCSSQTWTRSSTGPTSGLNAGRISLAISASTPATLYAAIANASDRSSTLNGLFKTTNSGSTWTKLGNAPDICNSQCFYDMTIKVHPNNPNVVFFGGAGATDAANPPNDIFLLRSVDGGNTWQGNVLTNDLAFDGTNEIHVDQHAIAFALTGPGGNSVTMFVGNDGGIWSTPMNAAGTNAITWTNLNATLSLSQFYPGISIHPSSQLVAFGGLQDNGSQKYDAGTNVLNPLQWPQVNGADGGFTYIDPATPSTVYSTTEFVPGSFFSIGKSLTNGDLDPNGNVTFSEASIGINGNDNSEFIPPLVGDPTPGNAKVLYFGTCNVYQTRDGANWQAMTNSLLGSCLLTDPDYTTIAAAKDGNTVYAGDSVGHVHVTTNALAGSTAIWKDVSPPPLPAASNPANPLDGRTITKIAVDPNNPQFAIVAYSGFCGFTVNGALDNVGHLFQTANGGTTWTDITGGCGAGATLANTPVNDIVIDPDDPTNNTIFIATDVGVFTTSNGGGLWTQLGSSLPDAAVLSLTLRNASRTLRAGTHGRGVWDFQLSGLPLYSLVSLTPVFASQGSGSITLTVNGTGFTGASQVQFGGVTLAPTAQTVTQLQVTVPLAQLATVASVPVSVTDPVAGTSNSLLFSVVVTSASPAPLNDPFPGFTIPSASITYTDTENTAAASSNTNGIADPRPTSVPNCVPITTGLALNGTANSIWYTWTAPISEAVEADTIGSAQDTILLVGTGNGGSVSSVACNDDIILGVVPQSQVRFSAVMGTTYHFMISNFEGAGSPNSIGNTVVFNFNTTPPPTLTMISPAIGAQGANVNVTLMGTNFSAPLQVNTNSSDVSVVNTTIVNSSTITATFQISGTANSGARNVSVTSNGQTSGTLPFTVTFPPPPTLTSISPATGAQGTSVVVTFTGTNFVVGATTPTNTGGLFFTNLNVINSTTMTATINIPSNLPPGPQSVTLFTSGGTTAPQAFAITLAPPPTLTMIAPSTASQGSGVNVSITGTNFISNASFQFSGTGVTVINMNITSGTTMTATFIIAANAPLGIQNVTLTTSGGTSNPVTFTVTLPPPPTLTSINPASGVQGNSVNVTLTGTNFISGATVNFSGAGVVVANTVVVSGTSITAQFQIAANAAVGAQNISVTAAGGTSGSVTFTVSSDFGFMPSSLSGSVMPGGAAMSTLTVTPTTPGAQFPGTVTFGCANLPFETTCIFSPSSLAATSTTPPSNMVNVSIKTTAPSIVPPGFARRIPGSWFGVLAWAGVLLAFAGLLLVRRASRAWRYVMGAVLVLALSGLAGACGGGGSGTVIHDPGTSPGGPFPITISVTSGGVTHMATFNLTVQ